MDLLDIVLEEGEKEQATTKAGEEAAVLSQMNIKAIETANESLPEGEKIPVPEPYKYGGSGMSVPTSSSSYFVKKDASVQQLRRLLPNIPF